jgi:hypothetical protein
VGGSPIESDEPEWRAGSGPLSGKLVSSSRSIANFPVICIGPLGKFAGRIVSFEGELIRH